MITHVTCGSYHTAAVSSNGDLFTWGGGMYGKLGLGNESGHSTPRRVETLVGLTIVDIACGSRHTAVVTNKGCLVSQVLIISMIMSILSFLTFVFIHSLPHKVHLGG